jgi:hypothetical protein
MSAKAFTNEQKESLKLMGQRLGPVHDWLRVHHRQIVQTNKAVRATLDRAGPATVPQVAEATGLDTQKVFWTIAAMRKYGQVREAGENGDYPLYELVEVEEQSR